MFYAPFFSCYLYRNAMAKSNGGSGITKIVAIFLLRIGYFFVACMLSVKF